MFLILFILQKGEFRILSVVLLKHRIIVALQYLRISINEIHSLQSNIFLTKKLLLLSLGALRLQSMIVSFYCNILFYFINVFKYLNGVKRYYTLRYNMYQIMYLHKTISKEFLVLVNKIFLLNFCFSLY